MDDTVRPFDSVRRFENFDADFDADASSFDADTIVIVPCRLRVDETHRRRRRRRPSSTHIAFVVVIARMDGSIRQLDCGGVARVTVALSRRRPPHAARASSLTARAAVDTNADIGIHTRR